MYNIRLTDIHSLENLITGAGSIAVTAHMRPDGDAVGSCTALYHCLRDMGKQVAIVLPDEAPSYLGFITEAVAKGDLTDYENDKSGSDRILSGCDLLFCLDYNAFHRTGQMESAVSGSSARKVLIDHHLNPDTDSFDLAFSETQVSSASELLYGILLSMGRYSSGASSLPEAAATALMTGMTTDTNNFANSVFPSTLRMASALLEAGVDRDMIIEHIYHEYREERVRLMGELLHSGMEITEDGVAYMVLDSKTIEKYHLQEGETEGFVNIPLSIGKVKMSCLVKEDKDRFRVSLRSKKGISANKCAAEYFHGGGHEQAAGGKLMIPDDIGSAEDVPAYIVNATHEFMNKK